MKLPHMSVCRLVFSVLSFKRHRNGYHPINMYDNECKFSLNFRDTTKPFILGQEPSMLRRWCNLLVPSQLQLFSIRRYRHVIASAI